MTSVARVVPPHTHTSYYVDTPRPSPRTNRTRRAVAPATASRAATASGSARATSPRWSSATTATRRYAPLSTAGCVLVDFCRQSQLVALALFSTAPVSRMATAARPYAGSKGGSCAGARATGRGACPTPRFPRATHSAPRLQSLYTPPPSSVLIGHAASLTPY